MVPDPRRFPAHSRGFLLVEALVALAIVAMMAGLVFETTWQMARTAAQTDDRRQALLLARSVLAAASVTGQVPAIPASGSDNGLAWQVRLEPFNGVEQPGVPLQQVHVVISDAAHGTRLAALDGLRAVE